MVTPRAKGYLIILAVFVLGVGVGGGASYAYVKRAHSSLLQDSEGGRSLLETRRLHALSRRLDLDTAQESSVRDLLAKNREDRSVQNATLDSAIRALLRPEQQRKFDLFILERREHRGLGPR